MPRSPTGVFTEAFAGTSAKGSPRHRLCAERRAPWPIGRQNGPIPKRDAAPDTEPRNSPVPGRPGYYGACARARPAPVPEPNGISSLRAFGNVDAFAPLRLLATLPGGRRIGRDKDPRGAASIAPTFAAGPSPRNAEDRGYM